MAASSKFDISGDSFCFARAVRERQGGKHGWGACQRAMRGDELAREHGASAGATWATARGLTPAVTRGLDPRRAAFVVTTHGLSPSQHAGPSARFIRTEL